jgi:putative ABC transport system permease protein
LKDNFALVLPGQVRRPTEVTVLFDAHGVAPTTLGANVRSAATVGAPPNMLNPSTISLGAEAVGMLLIALVAIGDFLALAQRRRCAMGMLSSLGTTERYVATVVVVNGAIVGTVGSLIGFVVGVLVWLASRPLIETSAGHVIDVADLPWLVIVVAMALGICSTSLAAWRSACALARLSLVASRTGPPPPQRPAHRPVARGGALLAIGLGFGALAGVSRGAPILLVPGLIALAGSIVALSPFALTCLGKGGTQSSVALRMASRDLARYRSRSAAALSAIGLVAMVTVVISVSADVAYSNPVNYLGPNLAPNELIAYTPAGNGSQTVSNPVTAAAMTRDARAIARSLGATRTVELISTGARLEASASGQHFTGPLYVATPQLLRAFGIRPSTLRRRADVLTMRPGLARLRGAELVWGAFLDGNGTGCTSADCRREPVVQQIDRLPSGTSAPNTVLTEWAIRTLGFHTTVDGWLISAPSSLSAAQVNAARLLATAGDMTIETKSSAPGSTEIANLATLAGEVITLALLSMTLWLRRSETADDLRTLSIVRATSGTRRSITAATAFSLALLGGVLGTVAAYVGLVGYVVGSETGLTALAHLPVVDLVVILIGMPVMAALAGYLLGGREQAAIAPQQLE